MSEGIDYILDQVGPDIMGTNLSQNAYNAAKYMGGKVYKLQNDYNDFRQTQKMAKSYIQSPEIPSPYMQYANPDRTLPFAALNVLNEFKRQQKLTNMDIKGLDDGNKHQSVGCVLGRSGMPVLGSAAAIAKEIWDYNRKINNPEMLRRYGGKQGIINDGIKDTINGLYGIAYGFFNKDADCNSFLYNKK